MTERLAVMIVDDEEPARQRLRKLLQPMVDDDRLVVAEEAGDGVEALEMLRRHEIDVLFLDIQMPELNGFDVLERIDPEDRPAVIFTTAYDDYAIRAFEANAVDYLLKPVSKERLGEAVSRVERARRTHEGRRVDGERLERLLDWLEAEPGRGAVPPPGGTTYMRQVSIPYRDRILLVSVQRLISAEISEGITRLFVLDEDGGPKEKLRQHVVNYTLDQLESNLDPRDFMRVHRSAIVQLEHIQEMVPWFSGRYKLVLTGDHEVIASRERSKQLKEQLMM